MSTEGIPTPRTSQAEIQASELSDWGTGGSGYVYKEFSQQLETELSLATRKLEQIRELVGDKVALLSTHKLKEILNS